MASDEGKNASENPKLPRVINIPRYTKGFQRPTKKFKTDAKDDQEVIELDSSSESESNKEESQDDGDSDIEVIGTNRRPSQELSRAGPHPSLPSYMMNDRQLLFKCPRYEDIAPGYIPTWQHMIPPIYRTTGHTGGEFSIRVFKLSLLSPTEFTVATVKNPYFSHDYKGVSSFRAVIKKIVRIHGSGSKASFERLPHSENPDGGRWRIPLSCYHPFLSFLSAEPNVRVEPIPIEQLKIVSVRREQMDKGYPSVESLMNRGVPKPLAQSLAPYQRGGADFVWQTDGRALIADEMGLGKTIQSIASMACFEAEWPLLVFCPSGARYHWEHEILHWLGEKSSIYDDKKQVKVLDDLVNANDKPDDKEVGEDTEKVLKGSKKTKSMLLLKKEEIHVLSTSKENTLPKKKRVVIASYGLGTAKIECGRLKEGMFKCIIVDESHMLKNKTSKRTKLIVPILMAAKRVVMLSGTPAFARPAELYPQLAVLGKGKGWWEDEDEFLSKYAKPLSRYAGSKNDNTHNNSITNEYQDTFEKMGGNNHFAELHTLLTSTVMIRRMKADILKTLPSKKRSCLKVSIQDYPSRPEIAYLMDCLREGKGVLGKIFRIHKKQFEEVKQPKSERLSLLESGRIQFEQEKTRQNAQDNHTNDNKNSRKRILNRLYTLTGSSKIQTILEMLDEWLGDQTKGKLCIFAHHLNILDKLEKESKLSNKEGSFKKYIRIDGSTSPVSRQQQITLFQTDPAYRVAILGITAAGVAVTLTAASTVWFSELFWTPGVLIQAEDRCHRIGQQTEVNILYFIAKGTLDEVLWKLVENKFKDLAEFVEGKENEKLVVQRIYNGIEDFRRQNENHVKESDNALQFSAKDEASLSELAEILLQNDITELGQEEEAMLMMSQREDSNAKEFEVTSTTKEDHKKGETETEAICLSDDDDDDVIEETPPFSHLIKKMRETEFKHASIPISVQMPNLRFYSIYFQGPKYGISLVHFQGRVVVLSLGESRMGTMKPEIGDILLSINSITVPLNAVFSSVTALLGRVLNSNPPVRLLFGEEKEFATLFKEYLVYAKKRKKIKDRSNQQSDTKNKPN